MNKEIKYIGFYDLQDSKVKRNISLAATNKMDYICDSLNSLGYNVHIVSPSYSTEKNTKFNKKEEKVISKNKLLTVFASFGSKNKFYLLLNILISNISLFFWLFKNIKKNETIIVYHSIWLSLPIRVVKLFKQFNYILELEEIYSDISHKNILQRNFESSLIHNAFSYVLVSEELKKKIGKNKISIIIYGGYKQQQYLATPIDDGKIHLVYSGTIDSETLSAYNAVEATRHLNENYVLHILGNGEIDKLNNLIKVVQKDTDCKIIYDGVKINEEYIIYMQRCHIGLNTRTMTGKFLSTSFPSKIPSYISLGINVVSSDIKSVRDSPFGDLISYYSDDTPFAIAEAIKKATVFSSEVLQERVKDLDREFLKELKFLLENE